MKSSRGACLKCIGLIVLLCFMGMISVLVGRYTINYKNLFYIRGLESQIYTLLINIRLPRTIVVVLSGMALSLTGYIYQKIFNNPLVSPDILGVSSGCSLGAVLAIVLFGNSILLRYGMAFIFGLCTVLIALSLSNSMKNQRVLGMVIAGIVISSMASSGIMIIKYLADPFTNLPSIEFWLMGGFYNSAWRDVLFLCPIVLIGSTLLYIYRWQIDILELGDDEAKLLGCNPIVIRRIIIITTTIMVSSTVAISGLISWVSLIAPHMIKMFIRERSNAQMLGSMMIGSILLLLADFLSRNAFASEVPISILISFVGGPFLGWMMYRKVMK